MKLQNKFLSFLFPAGALAAGLTLFLIQRSVHKAVLNDLVKNVLTVTRSAAQDVPHLRPATSTMAFSSKRTETGVPGSSGCSTSELVPNSSALGSSIAARYSMWLPR